MSLVTFEVEIDGGRVIPLGAEALPEKGFGLLTILPESVAGPQAASVREFIERWAGVSALPESAQTDTRLEYLRQKHLK